MKIADRPIGRDHPPYVIAEIGVNHDGDPQRALNLVRKAADAGADAVKFQWFEAKRLLSRQARLAAYQRDAGESDPVEMLSRLELDRDTFAMLIEESHARSMHAIVTIFSLELIDRAAELPWDAFKLASPDLVNKPLIEAIRAHGRPMILSTGGATLHEVRTSLDWIDRRRTMYFQCVSSYPAPPEHAALGAIRALEDETGLDTGYSDHTQGVDTGALAVAAGACALEKHFTDDRARPGPDHRASLEPEQFASYAHAARRAHDMIGAHEKRLLDIEKDVRDVARQSVAAARDLPAGHTLSRADLTVMRPGVGIPAAELERLIGAQIRRSVPAAATLTRHDVAAPCAPEASA